MSEEKHLTEAHYIFAREEINRWPKWKRDIAEEVIRLATQDV